MIQKNTIKNVKIFLILGWLLFGLFIIPPMISATNYSVSLQKGTIRQTVSLYDKEKWNSTVSTDTGPEDFFGKCSNITGANGKYIVRSWYHDTVNSSDLFFNLLLPLEKAIYLNINTKYNKSYIDETYNTTYEIGFILIGKWNFTTGEFPDNASFPNEGLYILKNPLDIKNLLENYNSFAKEVYNDFSVPPFAKLSNYTAQDFLFHLFSSQMAIMDPINTYLTKMVNNLSNENVSSSGNILKLELSGEKNYSVQITFGNTGLQSSISFQDKDGDTFYKIITYETEWIVWLIVGIFGVSIICVVGYVIYRYRKRQKEFQESLEREKS